MNAKLTIAILLTFITVAAGTACNPFSSNKIEPTQLTEVTRGDLAIKVNGTCKTAITSEAKLVFFGSGRVDKVNIKKGDLVKKGAVLASLETYTLELAVTQAQVALTQAQLGRATAEDDLKQVEDIYAQTEVLQARQAVSDAQKYVLYAQSKLDQASLTYDIMVWTNEVAYAKEKLRAAETGLDGMLAAPDTEKVALAKLRLATAEQSITLAQQTLEQSERQLVDATIKAPFDGLVVDVDIREGDIVFQPVPGTKPAIYLIDTDSMEVKAEIDEIDMSNVKVGQQAVVMIDAVQGARFDGKVTHISMVPIQKQSGVVAYEVEIKLINAQDSQLRVGMSGNADIIVKEHKNVLLVPNRAIKLDSQKKPFVEVVVDEQIERFPIELGDSDGKLIEVTGGLEFGAKVVAAQTGEKAVALQ